jgi:hypothetical protein
MRVGIPRGLRYRTVNLLEGRPPAWLAGLLRFSILLALVLMAAPWAATREIAFGSRDERLGLKPALRAMLWVWNRSWIPLRIRLGTFFDIGWHLSEDSCRALARRGFLSRDALKRQCDLAQLELATIRQEAQAPDPARLLEADRRICDLVRNVLNEAEEWAAAARLAPLPVVPLAQPGAAPAAGKPTARPEQRFDNDRTRAALLAFDDLAHVLGLRYFLVSGTFLGVVRDGAFIGHDHDIDLGVSEEDRPEGLLAALSASGDFEVTEVDRICLRRPGSEGVRYALMEQPAIIRLAHRNGISLDLFVHFHEAGVAWHGSSVHRWNNAAFPLADYAFLGRQFKGAADFDRYLCENYGPDWRIPKVEFNVNFDTPNLSFVGTANSLVYFAWMVTSAVEARDAAAVNKYIDMLVSLGVVSRLEGRLTVQ